jgi:hypothetical protein
MNFSLLEKIYLHENLEMLDESTNIQLRLEKVPSNKNH